MDFDFDELAYPETVLINGTEYKAQRDTTKGQVLVPYSEEPDVGIGDVICQKAGKREIQLQVTDVQFLPNGSLGVGTKHPHMLTLHVKNATSEAHFPKKSSSTINIGSISGESIQVGDHNVQIANISVSQLVEHIANSGDQEAKSRLKALLENGTVASLVGAGASALLGLL